MIEQLFLPQGLALDDETAWVPQAEGVWFRPLMLNVTQGYYVNLLRVRRAGVLSRHRHLGPVHAFTLRGKWRYLEHDWTASAGSYVFEPPGETHTLIVPAGTSDMITLFHVTGGYVYLDPQGDAIGCEDVHTKLAAVRRHYPAGSRGASAIEHLIR